MAEAETVREQRSLTAASRAARGRYPADVLAAGDPKVSPDSDSYLPLSYFPELHVLDSEWYFTPESSARLGAMVADSRPCLLGAPTVAVEIAEADYVLVDRSPYLLDRFPSLPPERLRNVDLQTWTVEPGHGAVVLDPPWYFPELEQWLDVALRAVELGGTVMLPLLGEETRPTAGRERDHVLELLRSTGEVEVLRDAIEYDIPLFEARALAAADITLAGPWRRADLAVGHVSRRPRVRKEIPVPAPSPDIEQKWETFLIGAQVVKLRASSSPPRGEGLLVPVDGVDDFTLDSVSRRDPRIQQIDLWSSRNRVARVVNADRLTRALRIAERSRASADHLLGELLSQMFEPSDINQLLDYLEMTDGD